MAFPIYIQADLADFDSPIDLRRSESPAFWSGTDVEFRIGVFQFGVLREVGDLASITLEIKPLGSGGSRPTADTAPLMSRTVSSLDNALTEDEWYAFSHQHAKIAFSAAESCIPAGTHWMVLSAVTKGSPAQYLTLCAGFVNVEQDGYDTAGIVQVTGGVAYTKAEADARFSQIWQPVSPLYMDEVRNLRLAADLAQEGRTPSTRCRIYSGGYSALPTGVGRAGWLAAGGALLMRVCASGAGTLADMGPPVVALTDSDGSAARVQVSLTLATGTLVLRSTARIMPLFAYRRLGVLIDAPVSGSLSAASVHVYVEGSETTLEVVGTSYTGAPAAGTGAWTLAAAAGGASPLNCRVAADGWAALNYPLTSAQYAAWITTGALPYEVPGAMQMLTNASFEDFTGTPDDDAGDSFAGWNASVGDGLAQAKSGGYGGGHCVQITTGTNNSGPAVYQSFQNLLWPGLVTISAAIKGDGTAAGRWELQKVGGATALDTEGVGRASTAASGAWTVVTRSWVINEPGLYRVFFYGSITTGKSISWDAIETRSTGNLLAGLDLAAQPICTRAASDAVLLDSQSGVALSHAQQPERMTLAAQLPMTADGYLLGDWLTHPAGYIVERVLVTNRGSASTTATIRAGSSGGTTIATGTVAATGLPVSFTISSLSALTASGGKIYVAGGAASSPLMLTLALART